MSELETPLTRSSEPDAASLQQQLQSLHKVIQLMLVALLLIGLCLTIFLWRQERGLKAQLKQMQPYVTQYDTTLVPLINRMVPDLQAYARVHAEINPLLDKYNLRQSTQAPPAGVSTPMPAAVKSATPVAPKSPAPVSPKK